MISSRGLRAMVRYLFLLHCCSPLIPYYGLRARFTLTDGFPVSTTKSHIPTHRSLNRFASLRDNHASGAFRAFPFPSLPPLLSPPFLSPLPSPPPSPLPRRILTNTIVCRQRPPSPSTPLHLCFSLSPITLARR
ncbi:hypothetical protein K438DRAFT_776232 [Mycena galopus ATCC 62051]|nr:hypothetical protein K438DRAFT_776232 [Mycena galopus ATCC 62051]